MKIGIFDSGVGGLVITKSIVDRLPQYDYLYLGDTANLPYGDKSSEMVIDLVSKAVAYLFSQDCKLVIIACNTASSEALRYLQQQFLPKYYPDRKVLGMIIPTVETALADRDAKHIAILATKGTVESSTYIKEIGKLKTGIKVSQFPAPELVPLIESHETRLTDTVLDAYVDQITACGADTLILGCTHYCLIKDQIGKKVGQSMQIVSQDEIIPDKLHTYLEKHSEIRRDLSQEQKRLYHLTARSNYFSPISQQIFGKVIVPTIVDLH